jgi:hypothetical protein
MVGLKRHLARAALAGTAATLLVGALGGAARASTVTVGSPLTATFAQTPFAADTTVTNFVLPTPANATSPSDGTVISWRFIGTGGNFIPRVIHPTAGTSHTGSGTGAGMPGAAPPAISGPFPTSLPIKQGDRFGVDVPNGGSLGTAATAGATYLTWAPPLVNGAAGRAPTSSVAEEAAVSATVRFCKVPNLKGLSGQAARQQLVAADCTIGTISKSRKQLPTKQVLKQSVKANSSIADTAPVGFTISSKLKPRAKPHNKCKKIRSKKKRKRCNKKRRHH